MQTSILRLLFFITAAGFEGILSAAEFTSDFGNVHNRVWVGQDYWANPMEDWIVEDGKLACIRGGANRNVHLLTYGLSEKKPNAPFSISVRLGLQKDSRKTVRQVSPLVCLTKKREIPGQACCSERD